MCTARMRQARGRGNRSARSPSKAHAKKIRSAEQAMLAMRPALQLAPQVGTCLGRSPLLLRTLSPCGKGCAMTTLRLILGDQLNSLHSWFSIPTDDVVYVLMEVRQETDYVLHHAQKILGIFAAMRDFADALRKRGHRVKYLAIDAPENRHDIPANLDRLIT